LQLNSQYVVIWICRMRQGKVYIKGQYAGLLTEEDSRHYSFVYDDDYLALPSAEAVSLTMPVTKKQYTSNVLFPFFSNMLSEGENRKFQSHLLRIDEEDDFGILLATANYDTIGCVTVKPMAK